MKYILKKDYVGTSMQGDIKLFCGVECEKLDNLIFYNNRPVCYATSQFAKDYFINNEDGEYKIREQLINKILNILNNPTNYEKLLKIIYSDSFFKKYRNEKTFNASFPYDRLNDSSIIELNLLLSKIENV